MELVSVTLTALQRRNRATFVRCADVPGNRELEPGERLVLRDDRGDYFAGTVVECDDRAGEPRYLLHVGVRLPEEFAMLRLGRGRSPSADPGTGGEDVQSLLDLLGDARDSLGGVPLQRLPY